MRIDSILHKVISRLRAFPKATRGNIGMILGIALIPLCLAAGAGLDMSRAMITRARMGTALDAAGLAVGSQPGMSVDDMKKLANQYFQQNYTADPNAYGKPDVVSVDRPPGSQTITLTTSVAMPTVLMRIAGIDTMNVAAKSEITWGQTKLWVALVLDNTGSMCEPDSQPCPHPSDGTKIAQLKKALQTPDTGLLDILKNAASNDGDVKVSIIPFSKDVNYAADADGTDTVNGSWVDWTDWEMEPSTSDGTDPKVPLTSSIGPGSNCPWTDSSNRLKSPYGYYCVSSAAGSSKVSKIPASGLICPGMDGGKYNVGDGVTKNNRASHYYNGCYNSLPTNTLTTTVTSTSTKSSVASCTSNKNGTCSGGTTTTNSTSTTGPTTSTATTTGYSGDSGPTTTTTTANPVVGNPVTTSKTKNGNTTYTTTVTTNTTTTTTVVTKTGAAPYTHSWIVSDHSTWGHCFMDRPQTSGDTTGATSGDVNVYPGVSSKFTAENSDACPPSGVFGLASNWTKLSDQVTAMQANGNTNQTVGLAWGWQTLSQGDPFNPGDLPVGTNKFLILLTDGLNTQNRTTTNETSIDARTKLLCEKIKADGITIFTVYVNLNPPKVEDAGQKMLEGCASPGGYFYALTQASEMPSTFQAIATKITNLRVSL